MKLADCPFCGQEITVTTAPSGRDELVVEIRSVCEHVPARDVIVRAEPKVKEKV